MKLCQMLWKYKEKHLTSTLGLLLNTLCIIDSNLTIHKSPGRKLDWEGVKSLLLRKWLNKELQITLSNILPKIGSKLIGR